MTEGEKVNLLLRDGLNQRESVRGMRGPHLSRLLFTLVNIFVFNWFLIDEECNFKLRAYKSLSLVRDICGLKNSNITREDSKGSGL